MSDLHGEIMNIPCDPSRAPVAGVNAELAYKYGHRDARHAAAELAAAHGAERAQPAEAEGVVAWAPSTALEKLRNRHNNAPCVLTDGPAEFNDVPLVPLAALSAVTAERDRLRDAAGKAIAWLDAEQNESGVGINRRLKLCRDAENSLRAAMAAKEA